MEILELKVAGGYKADGEALVGRRGCGRRGHHIGYEWLCESVRLERAGGELWDGGGGWAFRPYVLETWDKKRTI